jgi:polyisoprenoid-binding protein YceI
MKRNIHRWTAAGGAAIAFAALAADSGIDSGKSTVEVTFRQENVPVDAPFKTFSGHIDYDAAKPAAAKATLELDPGSLDLGSDDYSAEIRKKAWFDTADFPKATFTATSIKPGAAGHFDATGNLTIKGKALAITVPVSVTSESASTAFDGAFDIQRSYFGIGDAQWNDVIDDKVHVSFHLVQAASHS